MCQFWEKVEYKTNKQLSRLAVFQIELDFFFNRARIRGQLILGLTPSSIFSKEIYFHKHSFTYVDFQQKARHIFGGGGRGEFICE